MGIIQEEKENNYFKRIIMKKYNIERLSSKGQFVFATLIGLAIFGFDLNAQNAKSGNADWQIFLGDSLIISGNMDSNYESRPAALIDIDKDNHLESLTIIFNGNNPNTTRIEFKEQDSLLYSINWFSNKLILESESFFRKFLDFKGKSVKIFYSDDKLQQTPTLLGTLIVKKD